MIMCIVIDINTLSPVFNPTDQKHLEFLPVLKWICKDKGKIVFGGTKYNEELKRAHKYLRILRYLDAAGKVVRIDDNTVDNEEMRLNDQLTHRDFDDAHLVAIVIVSQCKVICTSDSRAHSFIKDQSLYPKHVKRPSIYSGLKNSHLLCDENIASCCKPAKRTSHLCDYFETT